MGQVINLDKFAITFTENTSQGIISSIATSLGVLNYIGSDKYLGGCHIWWGVVRSSSFLFKGPNLKKKSINLGALDLFFVLERKY